MSNLTRIAVLVTCHNRASKTLACLNALEASAPPAGCTVEVFLVDDGSTDETVRAVTRSHPKVNVTLGHGSLFWSKGMHLAQQIAAGSDPDYLLWLNDDTVLSPDALVKLMETSAQIAAETGGHAIVVGTTVDPETGIVTYGGAIARSRLGRFSYRKVWNQTVPVQCDVMNGNVVLVPRQIVEEVGSIDPIYEHAMGDTDYALRAREKGFEIYVAPGVIGHCKSNPRPSVHACSQHSLIVRWRAFTGRKQLPPKSWLEFTRRHGGLLWPAYFAQPYLAFAARATWATIARQAKLSR